MMSEQAKCFQTSERKARKEHKCCECYNPINKGDVYQYSSGVWDEPQSFKQCLGCYEIMKAADSESRVNCDNGVAFGCLRDWFFDGMSSDFKAKEFIDAMAKDLDINTVDLERLLA